MNEEMRLVRLTEDYVFMSFYLWNRMVMVWCFA